MAKKTTIIVISVVLVLAVAVGVVLYLLINPNKPENNSTNDEIPVSDEVYLDEDMTVQEYIIDTQEPETQASTEENSDFVPSDSNLSDNTNEVSSTNFTIERIVDHTTNEEVSGRVVFGKSFNKNENYIKFDSASNFEINLSGYLDKPTKGTYKTHDDIIYVEFEDGKSAEYDVKYTDNGVISYIIVNYGDYDVYFS